MRIGSERVGPVGVSLLVVAGIAGLGMAAAGVRNHSLSAASLASGGPSGGPSVGAAGSTSKASTATTAARRSTSRTAGTPTPPASSTTITQPGAGPAGQQTTGQSLSQSPYASYAYRVYPGPPSQNALAAMSGYALSTHSSGGVVTVRLTSNGTGQVIVDRTVPVSDKAYFVEANLGDDLPPSGDYNIGDDGILFTTPAGMILK